MPPSQLTESIRIPSHSGNGTGQQPREVSRSLSMSTSPVHQRQYSFGVADSQSYGTSPGLQRTTTGPQPKQLKPFREQDVKILLLENVNQTGQDILRGQGYQVEALKSSLPEDQLIEKIKYVVNILVYCLLKDETISDVNISQTCSELVSCRYLPLPSF
jgi:hypothetical protein